MAGASFLGTSAIVPKARAIRSHSCPEVLVLYLRRPEQRAVRVETLWKALQIQRLEGSRSGGLWDLYLDEPVLSVWEFAVAVRALGFQ